MTFRRPILLALAVLLLCPFLASPQTSSPSGQGTPPGGSAQAEKSQPQGSTQKKKKRVWTEDDMADLRTPAAALPEGFTKRTWQLQDLPPADMPVKQVRIALPEELEENTILGSGFQRVYQDDGGHLVVILSIITLGTHPETAAQTLDAAEEDYFAFYSGTRPAGTQTEETTLNGLPGRILRFETQGAETYTNVASLALTQGWPIAVTCKTSRSDAARSKDRCMAIIRSVSTE